MSTVFNIETRRTKPEDKVMNPDQFDQVVKAIVEGKYSWACVLILRFAGYNPAHYIPYRTYKRLIKGNRTSQSAKPSTSEITAQHQSVSTAMGYKPASSLKC